jgi:transposase
MILKYSVGLDISSQKVNGCISVIDINQKVIVKSTTTFSNNVKGFKDFDIWCRKHHQNKEIPLVICMEATGIYHENCALYLHESNYNVSIILPNKAKKYFQALGLKSKNDTIDAKGLAQMGAEQSLKKWQPMGRYFYELRSLTRQYQNLQEQKTVFKNQLHALENGMYVSKTIVNQLNKSINLFEKQAKDLALIIEKHLQSDQDVYKKVENICAIKGIATLSLATILAETNGFELFENYKQLVSYAGFDVVENESGKHTGRTKISKKGNSRIRRALFMPAFSAIQCKQKPFIDLYNRTFEKHGIKMKSYVAVQKKMLLIIYYLWKSGEPFNQNNSPENVNASEAMQDNDQKSHFSQEQIYKKENINETKKEVYCNSENK